MADFAITGNERYSNSNFCGIAPFQHSCLYMAVFLDDYHFDNPLHIKMQVYG